MVSKVSKRSKRKAQRKQDRKAKRLRKNERLNSKENSVKINVVTKKVIRSVKVAKEPQDELVDRNKLEKPVEVFPEDEEIARLEKKLGITGGKNSSKKMKRELRKDGFDAGIWDFLEELDKKRDQEFEEEPELNEIEEAEPVEQNFSLDKNTSYLPKENIYGQEIKQKQIRFSRLNSATVPSSENERIKKQFNRALNRLNSSNLELIYSDVKKIYRNNARNTSNKILLETLLKFVTHETQVAKLSRISMNFSALITLLSVELSSDIGAFFCEKLCFQIHKMWKSNKYLLHENKSLENICLLLGFLYYFDIFSNKLMFSFLSFILEVDVPGSVLKVLCVLSNLLNYLGCKLRKESPLHLKELIIEVRKYSDRKITGTKKNKETQVSEYVLGQILLLKNNRQDEERVLRLAKDIMPVIKSFKGKEDANISPLEFGIEDLLNAEKLGRWWIVGSSWVGNGSLNSNRQEKVLPKAKQNSARNKISEIVFTAPDDLVQVAESMSLKSEVRKAIFVTLFTASNEEDCVRKLQDLGLNEFQQRELVYVIFTVNQKVKKFNPYYSQVLPLTVLKTIDFVNCSENMNKFLNVMFWSLIMYGYKSEERATSEMKLMKVLKIFARLKLSSDFELLKNGFIFFLKNSPMSQEKRTKKIIKMLKNLWSEKMEKTQMREMYDAEFKASDELSLK
eukprot:snap_masked-scaffold_20-processed-gene-5.91-mRNA-1 protein AED:1.00 eAED:1.00 QI:0/0/0/0/1/1/2/0/679